MYAALKYLFNSGSNLPEDEAQIDQRELKLDVRSQEVQPSKVAFIVVHEIGRNE